jgi:hypothetical protein
MNITTYTVQIWGETHRIRADWANAGSPVMAEDADNNWSGSPMHGMQVADFRHDPDAAIRQYLREMAVAGGDDPDAPDVAEEIEAAIAAADPD